MTPINLHAPKCYVVIPVLKAPCLPLPYGSNALLNYLEQRATVFAPQRTEVWLVCRATREIVRFPDGKRIDFVKLLVAAKRFPAVMVNGSFLLQDLPPFFELFQHPTAKIVACANLNSDDAWAFAWRRSLSVRRLWDAMLALLNTEPTRCDIVASLGQGAAFIDRGDASPSNSPVFEGIQPRRGRKASDAPSYINIALQELLALPSSSAKGTVDNNLDDMNTEQAIDSLLLARDNSRVPWVFNALLNAIDHREGSPEPRSLPPEMHLSLTGVCNLECRFCAYTNSNALYQYIDLEKIQKLDFLRHVQVLRLSSGLGEPSLNKHLPTIINYLARTFPHLSLNFFTNAVALHRVGLIDSLLDQVKWINVSLNAANAQSWQIQHQEDKFDRVCANLQTLRKAKIERHTVFPLVFGSMVLNGKNLQDLPRMPALCRSLGIDRFSAFPYSALGYHTTEHTFGPEETLGNFRDEYDALYEETIREAAHHRVSLEIPAPTDRKKVSYGLEIRRFYDFAGIETNEWQLGKLAAAWPASEPQETYCSFLWRIACVGSTHKGSRATGETNYLYPCIGPLSSAELSPHTPFRFPTEAGFNALWRSPVLRHLRTAQRTPGLSKVCDKCRHYDARDSKNFPDFERLVAEFTTEMDALSPLNRRASIAIKAVESR